VCSSLSVLVVAFGIILCMCAFVVLDLVYSVLCQDTGSEERLRNDLFCDF